MIEKRLYKYDRKFYKKRVAYNVLCYSSDWKNKDNIEWSVSDVVATQHELEIAKTVIIEVWLIVVNLDLFSQRSEKGENYNLTKDFELSMYCNKYKIYRYD